MRHWIKRDLPSVQRVYIIMSQEKIQRNKKIYRDYKKGMNQRQLAEKYGISKSVIWEIIQRYNSYENI